MNIFILIVLMIIIIGISAIRYNMHIKTIREKIVELGGREISIERAMWLDKGPFHVNRKGTSVYKFKYIVGKETKIGWVKFSGLLGAKWEI